MEKAVRVGEGDEEMTDKCKICGHSFEAHNHYKRKSPCSRCDCSHYVRGESMIAEEEFDLAEGLESLAIIDSFDKWYETWYGEDKDDYGFWWWLPWNYFKLWRYVTLLKVFSAGWKALRDYEKMLLEMRKDG